MLTLLAITLLTALAAFTIRTPWREALLILLVLLVALLWLQWSGALGPGGRWA